MGWLSSFGIILVQETIHRDFKLLTYSVCLFSPSALSVLHNQHIDGCFIDDIIIHHHNILVQREKQKDIIWKIIKRCCDVYTSYNINAWQYHGWNPLKQQRNDKLWKLK